MENENIFLEELQNNIYVEKTELTEKEIKRAEKDEIKTNKLIALEKQRDFKRNLREQKLELKEFSKKLKKNYDKNIDVEDNDEVTEILGRDKIILLKKIKQYKSLFPNELGKFKIKKNPKNEDLQEALDEMAVLVEVNNVDGFLMDSILQSLKMIEGVSSLTKYDVRGMADLLKNNKEFHNLCKQLFIKYNIFSNVPPEYQILLIISTTAFICVNKNKNKSSINAYLDETV
jgi:hypothetical protein